MVGLRTKVILIEITIFRLKVAFDLSVESDGLEFLNAVAEPSNCVTQLNLKYIVDFIQLKKYRRGAVSVVMLEDDWIMLYSGIIFKAFSPFFDIYNENLGLLESNGRMGCWRWCSEYPTKPKVDEIGPQVLKLDHLWVGFLACLIPLALSPLVFAFEILSRFLLRLCSKIPRMNFSKPLQFSFWKKP